MTDSKPDVLSAASVEPWAAINALPPTGDVCTVERMKGVVRVEKALEVFAATAASAPFRIHDYMTEQQWERCCHLYAKHREAIEAARKS